MFYKKVILWDLKILLTIRQKKLIYSRLNEDTKYMLYAYDIYINICTYLIHDDLNTFCAILLLKL